MYNFMMRLANTLAIVGGIVLSALILLTCLSVLGRELNAEMNADWAQSLFPAFANWVLSTGIGPIDGDFEIVEAGIAFAIFSFLPLCQITAGHASVDIFTSALSAGVNRFLRMIADIAFALVLVLIAWRLFDGMISKYESGETTFILQFPVWWAYVFSVASCCVGALVSIYVAWIRIVEFMNGSTILNPGMEAEH